MALINPRILKDAIGQVGPIPSHHLAIVTRWAESVRDNSIRAQNETQLEGDFKSRILETLLGYDSFGAERAQTVKAKVLMGTGEVDLALGHFGATEPKIIAPFELKGARTADLDAPMPGRKITPVQQAWNYANAVRGVKWVLVSNMLEIRLYAFGEGNQDYERIDLSRIDTPEEYAKLTLLLSAGNLLGGATADLLKRSKDAEKDISERLYGDYKALREKLIGAVHAATGGNDRVKAIGTAQRVLDRVLFIAFAEDTTLLPGKLLEATCKHKDPYHPRPTWDYFKALFRAIDEGSETLKIPRYNGGLFRADAAIDDLALPDAICQGFMTLGEYDFKSEVSVTVLGHIFEQSVTDVERLLARARGEEPEQEKKTGTSGRRKRDGIVYTPDYIARFIVEKTLGLHVETLFRNVMAKYAKSGVPADYDSLKFVEFKNVDNGTKKEQVAWQNQELAAWSDYRMQLKLLRVVDPACGSGVFLVTAFDFLRAEYDRVNKKLSELRGASGQIDIEDVDREILSQNLYGVDVNEESVEITKLSLWIKTARRGKVLDSLDHTIRIGDSLLEDSSYDYRKHVFTWRSAFPEEMAAGGFDVVIGNPPYVRMELIKAMKPYLETRFEVYSGTADIYCYFFERGLRLLKAGGRLGFITSSAFFKTAYGQPLRKYIASKSEIDNVVDFGDLQIFEGVTTYTTIVTLINKMPSADHNLRFLKPSAVPTATLVAQYQEHAKCYPQTALRDDFWEFETSSLLDLRNKLLTGQALLRDTYGQVYRGVLTGLNAAFVVGSEIRERLVASEPTLEPLLKKWIKGRSVQRWRLEPDDSWLIFAKQGIEIDKFPGLKRYLGNWQDQLEPQPSNWKPKHATDFWKGRKQGTYKWFEIQDSVDYFKKIEAPKVLFRDISAKCEFTFDDAGYYNDTTSYFVPNGDEFLAAILNSNVIWFILKAKSPKARGGYYRFKAQYVESFPVPKSDIRTRQQLVSCSRSCQSAAKTICLQQSAFRRRIPDLCPPDREPKLNGKLHDWWELADFAAFRAAIKMQFKTEIPLKERAEWEAYFNTEKAEVARLTAEIERNEAEINTIVYRLFDLTPGEIALLEASL